MDEEAINRTLRLILIISVVSLILGLLNTLALTGYVTAEPAGGFTALETCNERPENFNPIEYYMSENGLPEGKPIYCIQDSDGQYHCIRADLEYWWN